jgi:NAD(P)H-hydrate epimerase
MNEQSNLERVAADQPIGGVVPGFLKIVSTEEMAAIEKRSDEQGLFYAEMMENAGRSVAEVIADEMPYVEGLNVLILAGPGNNGGDGLVCARYLHEMGSTARVYLWNRRTDLEHDYEGHFARLMDLGVESASVDGDENGSILADWLEEADVVVDALLGTGSNRPIEGDLADLLDAVNASQAEGIEEEEVFFLLAVDVPTGIHADTGEMDPHALHADMTVTLGFAKQGLFRFPGTGHVGQIVVADIGMDPALCQSQRFSLSQSHVAGLLPARPAQSHKGSFGKILVIAGSINYPGAAYLSGAGAARSGAGLVTLAVPQPVWAVVAPQLPEATWLLLPQEMGVINENGINLVNKELSTYTALLLGPGLGQEESTREFVKRLLAQEKREAKSVLPGSFKAQLAAKVDQVGMLVEQAAENAEERAEAFGLDAEAASLPFGMKRRKAKQEAGDDTGGLPPLVIDADGLNLLAKLENWPSLLPAHTILTPHPAEMARLCGVDVADVLADPWGMAQEKAAAWNAVVLLKGPYTVIAGPDGRMAVLPVATPALATGGTGDVLAGLIAGLLSQGLAGFDAACLGAWLHGRAGEVLEAEIGPAGSLAGDLLPILPEMMNGLR